MQLEHDMRLIPVEHMTKEVDLEHLEHAGFDPEVAAYERGFDPEDLGYPEGKIGACPSDL